MEPFMNISQFINSRLVKWFFFITFFSFNFSSALLFEFVKTSWGESSGESNPCNLCSEINFFLLEVEWIGKNISI